MGFCRQLAGGRGESLCERERPRCLKPSCRPGGRRPFLRIHLAMIRKLKSGEYRLYSRKKSESTGKRRNLGTFTTLEKAKQHEREVQYFKKH
jgi:hypothetical protein